MFGGLTKTSSRIAIAAALGLVLGGFAFKATPAQAADLGGDCCADLEERVAELEATTVRKGNKKVSVTLSGWVVKSVNWWDDGDISSFAVGDKDADLASRFAITGSATIAPGWSGGFNITVVAPGGNTGGVGGVFGIAGNQEQEFVSLDNDIRALYSFIYLKSDTLGALNWGYLSPASDNKAVLADISGTVIESNAVFFEGPGFFLRPKGSGANGYAGLTQRLRWADFVTCYTGGGVGADCFGAPRPAVRYDSPTWGGFRFETSYGTVEGAPSVTPASNFWDAAVIYTADWNSIKLSAAYTFTWTESNVGASSAGFGNCDFRTSIGGVLNDKVVGCGDAELHQVGASIMHKPSGLGIYGLYQHEEVDDGFFLFGDITNPDFFRNFPDTEVWYVKPFWRKAWSPIGASVLYGEYGEYHDQFGGIFNPVAGVDLQGIFACNGPCFVTGSEVQRWGVGFVQEIDSAAMHLWVRWQHQELDLTLTNLIDDTRAPSGVDDWDLFQAGGIIFF